MEDAFMQAALDEAAAALERGDFPVGAVLVHDGRVVYRGRNQVTSGRDSTLHGEMNVLQQAAAFLQDHEGECELYTTLEPCMMCAGAIAFAGVRRVVYATADPSRGAVHLLGQLEFYRSKNVDVAVGVLGAESETLLSKYASRQ